jgi:uncharacterized protein (DUF1800 family)
MDAFEIAQHRFGYGPKARVGQAGNPRRALLRELERFDPTPPSLRTLPSSKQAITDYFTFRRRQRELSNQMGNAKMAQEARLDRFRNYSDASAARGLLAIESDAAFAERLTHFWANHFAVSVAKTQVLHLAAPHEFEAIRPHVMGSFGDMLAAAVLHPAMLVYLDQVSAAGPNSGLMKLRNKRFRRQESEQVNENLAREILELHTLGVNGGYRHGDIVELAKALTGWSVINANPRPNAVPFNDGAIFIPLRHEPGVRNVLGRSYPTNGVSQVRSILKDLATHPATARHVATKLARHFTADSPPQSLVRKLEANFLKTGGDLPSLYETLVNSSESWEPTPRKFKQPWEWVIAAYRGTGTQPKNRRRITQLMRDFGQRPWGPASPAGYEDTAVAWAGPDALMRRVNVANAISRRIPAFDVSVLAQSWFPASLSHSTRTAITRAESPRQAMALLLVSPEMMRR